MTSERTVCPPRLAIFLRDGISEVPLLVQEMSGLQLFLLGKGKTGMSKQWKFILPEIALCLSFVKEEILLSLKPNVVSGNGRHTP